VTAAIASDTKADWDKAKTAVDALSAGTGKTTQADRLSAQLPETLVAEAEAKDTQATLDVASAAVAAMASGAAKTALNVRIVAQQTLLISNATAAVVVAEGSSNYKDRDAALELVTALPASATKTQLQSRLADIATAVENVRPEKAMDNAEASDKQVDLDYAKQVIDALAGSGRKDGLVARLSAQQTVINGLVDTAIAAANTQAKINDAQALVDVLPAGTFKTAKITALVAAQKVVDDAATALVTAAEAADTQATLTTAKTAVDLLNDGALKTSLTARITAQQTVVDLLTEIKTIEAGITSSVTKQDELDAVLVKVNALPDSATKTALLLQISAVQKVSDLLNVAIGEKRATALAAVVTAETNFTKADNDAASTAVEALLASALKTELSARLAVLVTKVTQVETAVAAAESAKTQATYDAAATLVAGMTASSGKTAFSGRLVVVKTAVDAAKLAAAEAAATAAVQAAANADTAATLAAANAAVAALPDGDLKTRLSAVLSVQAEVTAAAEAKAALDAGKGSSSTGIAFSLGSSRLSAVSSKRLLAAVKAARAEHNVVMITVAGVGANRDLALSRAVSIVSALKKAGINVRVTLTTSTKKSNTSVVTFNWQD
jgi:hypothetical protein